jgi:hypothetical protein
MTPFLAPGILLGLGTLYLFIHAAASSVGDGVGADACGDRYGGSSEQSTVGVLASSTSAPPASADSITAVIGGGNNRVPAEERWAA